MGEQKPVRLPAGLGLLVGEELRPISCWPQKPVKKKINAKRGEQQKLRETNRNLQKAPETIRQLDFRRRNSREKVPLILPLQVHCLRGFGTLVLAKKATKPGSNPGHL